MTETLGAEIFRSVLDKLAIGVCLVNRSRQILFWNEGAEAITGYMRYEVIGRLSRDNILVQCNDIGCVLCGAICPFNEALREGKPREAQVYLRHKAGHRIPVHVRVVPIRDDRGLVIGAATSFDERTFVSDADFSQDSLAAHGCLDLMSGVANHAFTQFHLRESLASFLEYGLPFGILCIALDQLEHLKDTHGQEATEAMLHVVAQTIRHTLGPAGFLGRWRTNEFVVILSNCSAVALERASASIQKLVSASEIQWWDDQLSVTVSVAGAMVHPGDTLDSLVSRAEHSLAQSPVAQTSLTQPGQQEHHRSES